RRPRGPGARTSPRAARSASRPRRARRRGRRSSRAARPRPAGRLACASRRDRSRAASLQHSRDDAIAPALLREMRILVGAPEKGCDRVAPGHRFRDKSTASLLVVAAPRIAIRKLGKAFGSTPALAGVDLEAGGGEVHAILGENGAGKSTLLKVLAGVVGRDAGTMEVDGQPWDPSGPADARTRGLAMVHQELALCPHLDVPANVALGIEPARLGLVRGAALTRLVE